MCLVLPPLEPVSYIGFMLHRDTLFTPAWLLGSAAVAASAWALSRWLGVSERGRGRLRDAGHLLAVGGLLWFAADRHTEVWSVPVVHLSAAVTIVVAWLSQRLGRPPSLSGWLLGPTLGLLVLAGSTLSLQTSSHTQLLASASAVAQGALVCVCLGVLLGGSALHPAARRRGVSSVLAALSAILVCIGGALSCQHTVIWTLDRDFALAEHSWVLRERFLLAAAGVAVASPLLRRLLTPTTAPRWKPDRLGPVLLATMTLSLFVALWQADRLLQPFSDQPHPLTSPPTCLSGDCGGSPPLLYSPAGWGYPVRQDAAVIEVSYRP